MEHNPIPTFSFWEKQFYSQWDMAIIGNGIVGLQCAIHLKNQFPNKKIMVLDRAPASLGASMRNAGFACFGSMGEILDDIRQIGEESAYALYEKRFKGIDLLKEDFGETAIGYEKTGGYEIFEESSEAESKKIFENVDRINAELKRITLENPFQIRTTKQLGMKIQSQGIFTPFEGALQTHLLYDRIYQKCIEKGIKILTGIDIQQIEQETRTWKIRNANGYPLESKYVILCTNGFTRNLIPDLDVQPARGQVLVTTAIPGLPWRGLMHADKGYIYFRSLGTRILIGGARNLNFEEEQTTDLNVTSTIQNRLVQFLKEVVIPGEKFEITDSWAGIMGMSNNRTPVVKKLQKGLFACVRMGGMGVALSALVSRELAQLVKNES